MQFVVEPQHFEYLVVQRGRISDLRGDFPAWKKAYDDLIEWDFQRMLPVLPKEARKMLDVGGGLSGISARINKHYGEIHCVVLDGKNDAPVVKARGRTYNNATLTQNFLRQNGVKAQQFVTPSGEIPPHLDLVVSIQAWGFHFSPDTYARKVKEALNPGAVVIMDVRSVRTDWFKECLRFFGQNHRKLASAPKWDRWAFSEDEL